MPEIHNWLMVAVFVLQVSAGAYSIYIGAPKVGLVMILVGFANGVMATIKT